MEDCFSHRELAKRNIQLEKSNVAGIRANLVRWPRKDGNDEVQSDSSVIDR
ncbi:hypothetical protein OAG56_07210 [Mariniblastus sp.]|nr:hypothetical protein [Mariniblastus sp.]MDB4757149.1 hypothetical protein [Mariniblastus sp.]